MDPLALYRLADRPKGREWQTVVDEYNATYRGSRLRIAMWWIGAAVGAYLALSRPLGMGGAWFGLCILGYSVARIDRWDQHWNGFFDGYQEGRETGVYAAYGIRTPEEVRDQRALAVDIAVTRGEPL